MIYPICIVYLIRGLYIQSTVFAALQYPNFLILWFIFENVKKKKPASHLTCSEEI